MKSILLFYSLLLVSAIDAQIPDKQILLNTKNNDLLNLLAIDVDNDGDNDYIGQQDKVLILYVSDQSSVWEATHILDAIQLGDVEDILAADVNGDGFDDLAVFEDIDDYSFTWYENPGNTEDAWTEHLVMSACNFIIGLFDVNSDNEPDLVYESLSGYLDWYENDGGSFTTIHSIPDDYPATRVVVTHDFDKDGDTDWSAYFYDCCTMYFENNGDGTFTSSTASFDENQDNIYVGDVNGDTYADIIVNDLFNYGVAIFDTIDGDFATDIAWEYFSDPLDLQSADIDNDGDEDLVAITFDPLHDYKEMKWMESNGAQVWLDSAIVLADSLDKLSTFFVLSDYDGDERPDLFAGNNRELALYHNNFPEEIFLSSTELDTLPIRIDFAQMFDVDGDLDNDIMAVSDLGKIGWFENEGGVFGQVHFLPFDNVPRYPTAFDFFDFDQDGDNDFIISFQSAYGVEKLTYYFVNDGTGTFARIALDDMSFSKFWFTDGNEDGDYDLIAMNSDYFHNLYLYTNSPVGDSIFIYYSNVTTGTNSAFEMLDLDNDGDQDFIGADKTTNDVKKVINTNAGAYFGAPIDIYTSTCDYPATFYAGDFDEDGQDEFYYTCYNTGEMYSAVSVGFDYVELPAGNFIPFQIEGGYHNNNFDIDLNGFSDMIFSDYQRGTYTRFCNGAGELNPTYLQFLPDFGMFGDLDGDSLPDFVGINSFEFYYQNDFDVNVPDFTVIPPTSAWLEENGAYDSVIISFNWIPPTVLKLNVYPAAPIDAGNGEGMPVEIEILPDSSALIPIVIKLHVNDDAIVEDIAYSSVMIQNDSLNWDYYYGDFEVTYNYLITDNELGLFFPPVTIAALSEGSTINQLVHVNMIPDSPTTLIITPAADFSTGLDPGEAITFTIPANEDAVEDKLILFNYPDDVYYVPEHISTCAFSFESDDSDFSSFDEILNINLINDEDLNIWHNNVSGIHEEGSTFSITVHISAEPYETVMITAMPDPQIDLGYGPGIPREKYFLADGTFYDVLSFSCTVVDDLIYEGLRTSTIHFIVNTDDPYFAGFEIAGEDVTITDNEETSIENTLAATNIYPSLSDGLFDLDLSGMSGEIAIAVFDISGAVVYQTSATGGSIFSLDLTTFSAGMYSIRLSDEQNISMSKIEIF